MSINKGMWHKLWSRHCLVGSSEMQKAKISLGEMLIGGKIRREPDKAERAIRLQSKSDPSKDRARED